MIGASYEGEGKRRRRSPFILILYDAERLRKRMHVSFQVPPRHF